MISLDDIIAEIRNGIDLEQSNRRSSPDMLPISRIETISEGVIDFSRVKYATPTPRERQKYQLQSGDILFSHINSPEHIGKTALFRSNKPLIHGINLLLLRVNREACHPEYLNFYLKSFAVRARFRTRCKKAVNQASLNQDDILSLDVPIPTLPEQKRIAAILENADWLRRTRRYARQLSETFLESAFLEMFDSFLIKEENEVLKNVLALPLSNGSFESNKLYGSGAPVIWVDNLYHTITIDLSHLRRARLSQAAIAKYQVLKGDLLFTRSSLVREGIGQINIVPRLPERTAFECHIIRARVDEKKVNPFYVLGLYRSLYGRNFIMRRANTATMTTISQTAIEELPCPIPPLPLQETFAAIVQRFEHLRAQRREAERQAEHLFQTLLRRAFNGDI